MNKNKQYIYDFKRNAPKAKTIDLWLKKYKAKESTWLETYKECFYVEAKPIRRHRRSFALRNQCLVLGRTSDTRYHFKHKPMRKVGEVYYWVLPRRGYVDHNMDLLFKTENNFYASSL